MSLSHLKVFLRHVLCLTLVCFLPYGMAAGAMAAAVAPIQVTFVNSSSDKWVEVRVRGTSERDQSIYFEAVLAPGESLTTMNIPANKLLSYKVRNTIGQGDFKGAQLGKLTRNTRVILTPCTNTARWCFRFQ